MSQLLDLILLVDDDETTNFVNNRLLSRMNIAREIKIAKNGQEAIDYLKDCEAQKQICPDLIFLDIKMPVMDGFSFLETYEAAGLGKNNQVIIMMLTSSASFYDLERLKNYKFVKQHISKALTEGDIKEILQQYFANQSNN
ncbi:response regulator [Adhaeribacter aquaticus]|uniref:response regulator n=1 Tax=Adhaeribacter aquaticus TaxID=299567 RepID=UPI0004127984|nr:response regulator [Adhaeribacter aquaticus]